MTSSAFFQIFGAILLISVITRTGVDGSSNRYDNEEEYLRWDAWEAPPDFKDNFPAYMAGYDYEGRPVWVLDLWKWNLSKLVASGEAQILKFENYTEQFRYRLYNSPLYAPGGRKEVSNGTETDGVVLVDSWVLLINLDKFDLKQLTNFRALQLSMKMWSLVEIATENMDYGFMVNTNFIAERFFNTLKPVMGRTLAKLYIRGTRKEKWLPEVLKYIPLDVLPVSLGGHRQENNRIGSLPV